MNMNPYQRKRYEECEELVRSCKRSDKRMMAFATAGFKVTPDRHYGCQFDLEIVSNGDVIMQTHGNPNKAVWVLLEKKALNVAGTRDAKAAVTPDAESYVRFLKVFFEFTNGHLENGFLPAAKARCVNEFNNTFPEFKDELKFYIHSDPKLKTNKFIKI